MRQAFSVGLYEPKFDNNVGGVLRAAHCYGGNSVIIQGERYTKQPTDVSKAYKKIPVIHTPDIIASIPYGFTPVAVEFIQDRCPLPQYKHPSHAFYIFGGEDKTLPPEVISQCQDVIYVPTHICMNLMCSVNVVLYDRMAKHSRLTA